MENSNGQPVVFDDDNPEWTEEDFARARPAAEVLPPEFMAAWRAKRGRPKGSTKPDAKQQVSLRLDRDVIAHFRDGGPGWQSRINAALRKELGMGDMNTMPLREDVAAVLTSAQQLTKWIATRQHDLEIKTADESRIPGLLFDLTLEHHVGIVHLITGRMYGSAFALIRSEFEAFVRAVWLQICATSQEINDVVTKDSRKLKFGEMITAIEDHQDFSDKVLSGLKANAWDTMNGYTHGGRHQIARRMKGDIIEPNYDPEEVIEALKASGFIALMALRQIARLADSGDLENEVRARLTGAN